MRPVDLRSDTVTRPGPAMLRAMAAAPLGDEVWGDDPTVHRLAERMRELTGKAAAAFFPTGTQSNLAAILSWCGRGDEVIVGREAHVYVYEGGGAAAFGGVSYWPVETRADGTLPLEAIAAGVRADDPHFPATRLVCLENTHGGRVLPADHAPAVADLARRAGLALHLDGARLWNASIASGRPIAELCAPFDTVSLCFSKGMGTPAGTVLVGPERLMARALRLRKALGGAMRQTGVLAAACLHALDHKLDRLVEDHANAARLAAGLGEIAPLQVLRAATNMVYVAVPAGDCAALERHLAERDVLTAVGPTTRLVTHLDVDAAGVDRAVTAVGDYFAER